jgi:hypothetical protein
MKDLLTNFENTLPLVFAGTFIPSVFLGITGAIISLKKIKNHDRKRNMNNRILQNVSSGRIGESINLSM